MARKTFFNKLTNYVLDKDDEEESAEDIDRRLEAELAEIESQEVETLDGETMLKDDWQDNDDVVYIMDLGPLYAIVGGRQSMLGKRLPDACENIFERLVSPTEGRGRRRADLFLMSFSHPSREAGFKRAAEVINEIGLQTIGERFNSIEIPDLFIAADPKALADGDGNLDLEKAKAEMESGGIGCSLGEPGPDDPIWLQFSMKKATKAAEVAKAAPAAEGAEKSASAEGNGSAQPKADVSRPRRRGDPDWVEERTERRMRISSDPMQMERRSGRDRRANR